MKLNKQKKQRDPSQKDIKLILSLLNSSKFIDAKKEINRQIINYPNSSVLFNILGAALAGEDNLNEAIKNYEIAIKNNPNYAQAYSNLGIALHKLGKMDEAINKYKQAIGLKNDFAEALNNLGNATREIDKPREALLFFERAIEIKSDYAEAFNSMGGAYQEIGNKKKALESFQKAIKIKPNYAEAYNNLGMEYNDIQEFDSAMKNYKMCIKLKPEYVKAYNNLANLLSDLGRYEEANDLYLQAIKIKPNYPKAYSNLLFCYNYKSDYDPKKYLSYAKKYRLDCKPINKEFSFQYQYEKNPKKLRLGLVSADFGNHPGGYFTLSTLRELIKRNFELVAYATTNRNDEFSEHFKPLFLKWNKVRDMKDEKIVEQIYKDGIHILLDLQGHSALNKLSIFMYKAAPVQASWLGQGSTGIPEIDYFIGSPHITPKSEEGHYVEKVMRLPEISQVFTPPNFDIKIKNLPATKNKFITFGCLNKLTKVNNDVVALWSKILLSIPNSKLYLKTSELNNKKIIINTIDRFKKNNVGKNRLILEGKSKTRKEVLEVYNNIDIALDPFPFQGNTSTIEAVWMGVPVLTLKGNRYLFHFGESINSNLNMKEWIAENYDEYISKAIIFSSNIEQLSKIRMNLREIALNSAVFDASRFSEHFSKMLWDMWKKYNKKL